jgi:uncharacterized membrane-anchored protein
MKKLPRIDLAYWVMIISANTIGETAGDLISMSLGLGYGASTAVLIGLFAAAAIVAVSTRTQHPALYWTVIILSSTAGTTMSDLITRKALGTEEHAAYGTGVLVILAAMTAVFAAWRLTAPRTHVSDPMPRRVEFLYWAAILTSSTLGTAFGDYLSNGTPLGFAGGSIVLAAALAVVALLTFLTRLPRDLCYWLAIIVTHPLGATVGDYMTKEEGLDLGNAVSTAILSGVFVVIVIAAYLLRRPKAPAPAPASTI